MPKNPRLSQASLCSNDFLEHHSNSDVVDSSRNTISKAAAALADNESLNGECTLPDTLSSIVLPEDKLLVPDYVYYTMQQMLPCKLDLNAVGGSRAEMPPGFPGFACRFCANTSNHDGRRFFYSSPFKLWNSFGNIASHILECQKCPANIRITLEALKIVRSKTRARGSQKKFMEKVWNRLHSDKHVLSSDIFDVNVTKNDIKTKSHEQDGVSKGLSENKNDHSYEKISKDDDANVETCKVAKNDENDDESCKTSNNDEQEEPGKVSDESDTALVHVADKPFATEFTYLVMRQLIPCRLDYSDHGRRNLFPVGFGGMQCQFCAPYGKYGRKFFYRSVDVLAGNYAQIPNHLLACKWVPDEIKKEIENAKKLHTVQKNKFLHGSQREFLGRVWNRVHCEENMCLSKI